MDIGDDYVYEPEEEGNEFLGSAVVKKIEKAKLYQMLLTCDFFDDDVSDQEILLEVTKEVRRFVHFKLECLLGARQGDSDFGESTPQSSLPWTQPQVEALTVLANNILNRNSKTEARQSAPSIKKIQKPTQTVQKAKAKAPSVRPKMKKEVGPEEVVPVSTGHRLVNNPDRLPMPSQLQMDTINAAQAEENSKAAFGSSATSLNSVLGQVLSTLASK